MSAEGKGIWRSLWLDGMPALGLLAALAVGLLAASPALAHKGSDAFLDIQSILLNATPTPQAATAGAPSTGGTQAVRRLALDLSVAIRDLDLVVALDANADGRVTWGEARAALPEVAQLLNQTVQLNDAGNTLVPGCRLDWKFRQLERRSDGTYLQLQAQAECPAAQTLTLGYSLFKAEDANHRLLVVGQIDGKPLLTTMSPTQTVPLQLSESNSAAGNASPASPPATDLGRMNTVWNYSSLGAHHLLEGYDHLAFLLALVLPLQLTLRLNRRRTAPLALAPLRQPGALAPTVAAQGNVWLALLRTITAFTIGHSITLIMATLGWTTGSPNWVEPVIALSIGVTALLNLRPLPWVRTDVLALGFGLVHGYGFAGLLQEAAAPEGLLPYALAGFNLGVEAGQLMAVAGWVALSQFVVNQPWYHSLVVRRGSQLLTLLAAFWFWQRVA